jgi:hypothetical protein
MVANAKYLFQEETFVFENYKSWKKFDFFAQKCKNLSFDRFLSLV